MKAARAIRNMSAALAAVLGLALPSMAGTVTVFAAASLSDAFRQIEQDFEAATGHDMVAVLAGSATLARQIAAGAPADVYVPANEAWMDWLEARGRIAAGSRIVIAENSLVLVAPAPLDEPPGEVTAEMFDRLGDDGRLAMAFTSAVPAGIYGKAALESLALWRSLAPRVAEADSVRAAMAFVATGEAPLGIVYETDALAEPRVDILGRFDAVDHPPIIYPAAIVAGRGGEAATSFLDWLAGPQAQAVLAEAGFAPAPEAPAE